MGFAKWLTVLGAGLAALLSGCGGSDDDPALRLTSYGLVQGTNDAANGTVSWKGIPFAQAPVGPLRWKAPVEPAPWRETLSAQRFGNACLQNGRIYGPGANNTYDGTIASTLNTPVGSEDCLTLNVWRPSGDASGLPVIFFVYGGSNISGYTADPVYDGAALAKAAKAVVITSNYRVGPLGFFNLPQLKSGTNAAEDSGNFALLDIIQALKFVKSNAAVFGGDPGNVTLMGQSAGAINAWALMTSPLAAGLFQRLAPLSGGISLATNLPAGSLPTLNPASTYLTQANALLAKLLIADGSAADTASAQALVASKSAAEVAAYLRGKDAKLILSTLLASGLTGSGPIPDGTVLPTDPIAAIAAGRYNKVPVLASNTAEEGKLFAPFLALFGGPPGFKVSDATRFNMMANYNGDAPTLTEADILDPAYLPSDAPTTGWTAKTRLLGGIFMTPSRDNVLNTLKTQQPTVWYYQFNWAREPAPWNTVYGAAHAFDLPFVFGNFGPSLFSNAIASSANRPGRLALSSAMMASIGAFARSGDPNNEALGKPWQPWPAKLIFDATPSQAVITTQ
ncbi:carboxylesterase/lipase family protein [Ramlibacter sp.]|uniref:carboxylesterase/lipase family protein n=1 Tax=Ramlibacter sp. TaxID=1917967 RepID=UPI002C9514DC|nr:carboxylesterase family protein [Ramlibacter sp.]HWI84654.1 carboxylesterase family protein [Ramlibacter sp.]